MFSHIMLGAADIEAAKTFYDATMGALGYEPGVIDSKGRLFYITPTGVFALSTPLDGNAATAGNGSTIGLVAPNTDASNAWYAAGLANGGTACEEPPGVRDSDMGSIYLAYLRDPTGNKLCTLLNV